VNSFKGKEMFMALQLQIHCSHKEVHYKLSIERGDALSLSLTLKILAGRVLGLGQKKKKLRIIVVD
jgi:hypothetical protein